MFLGFIEPHTLYIIVHLIGVAIGAGGAFMSDIMFFSSIKDKKISKTEMRFLTLGSTIVWIGLVLLVVSGSLIFFEDTAKYLDSSKFLAKMSIIGIIILNGVIFHLHHIPHLRKHIDIHFHKSTEFIRKRGVLIISGVISAVSWVFAIILGALGSVPYSFGAIMTFYTVILVISILASLALKEKILPSKK